MKITAFVVYFLVYLSINFRIMSIMVSVDKAITGLYDSKSNSVSCSTVGFCKSH